MTSAAPAAGASRGLNVVVLCGQLSSEPRSRTLPSGDIVWSYEVTTRLDAGPAQSVPVVLGRARPPKRLSAGDEVIVIGRVRRRYFRAGGHTASRTEVVADRLSRTNRHAAATRALDDAARTVADHAGTLDSG